MGILSSATHVKMCQMLPFLLPAALYRITDQCSRDNFQTTKKNEQKSKQNSLQKIYPPPPPPPAKKQIKSTNEVKQGELIAFDWRHTWNEGHNNDQNYLLVL